MCPRDTVVFTCVTDTGVLLWEIINVDNQHLFSNPAQINTNATEDIFTLMLLNVTGENNSIYWSTATAHAHHVPLNYSGRSISCYDNDNKPSKTFNITLGENFHIYHKICCIVIFYVHSTSPISTT